MTSKGSDRTLNLKNAAKYHEPLTIAVPMQLWESVASHTCGFSYPQRPTPVVFEIPPQKQNPAESAGWVCAAPRNYAASELRT